MQGPDIISPITCPGLSPQAPDWPLPQAMDQLLPSSLIPACPPRPQTAMLLLHWGGWDPQYLPILPHGDFQVWDSLDR